MLRNAACGSFLSLYVLFNFQLTLFRDQPRGGVAQIPTNVERRRKQSQANNVKSGRSITTSAVSDLQLGGALTSIYLICPHPSKCCALWVAGSVGRLWLCLSNWSWRRDSRGQPMDWAWQPISPRKPTFSCGDPAAHERWWEGLRSMVHMAAPDVPLRPRGGAIRL